MVWQRVWTGAVVFATTIGVVLTASAPVFLGLSAVCLGYGGWEWSRLIGLSRRLHRGLFVLALSGLGAWAWCFTRVPVAAVAVWWWVGATVLVVTYRHASRLWGKSRVAQMVMGMLTLVPAWVALNAIRQLPQGIWIVLFLSSLVWVADTGAYFVGRAWGRHLLIPSVSPKKTWEGAAGGLVCALAMALVELIVLRVPIDRWGAIMVVSAVTVFFSVIGDLSESMIKRNAGIKDSGRCLPGHGGLLDRIDSLTAAAPIFWMGLLLIGR